MRLNKSANTFPLITITNLEWYNVGMSKSGNVHLANNLVSKLKYIQ